MEISKALQQCAAEGITVLASSGDDGSYGDKYSLPYNVSDPAAQPYVTGVGGTTLFTDAKQEYITEQAWNEFGYGIGATGGGVSSYWSIPSYQSTEPSPGYTSVNGGSSTMRNVPDIAAVGDPLTGVGVYVKDQGGWVQVGGTSLSCPIWAGYLGTINAVFSYAGLGDLGFFNPTLYAVGTSYEGYGYPADWLHNVVEGSNGYEGSPAPGYINGRSYSNTTGSGSIWGGGFGVQLLTSQKQPGTPPRNFWFNPLIVKPTSLELSWATSNGAAAYVMGLYYNAPNGLVGQRSFVTKETKLKIDGLTPNTTYWVFGWSFNASGAYETSTPYFQTPN